MPNLCDFTQVVGDRPVNIGDREPLFERTFGTGGRQRSPAFLIFNVRHLTHSDLNVPVSINGHEVGFIHNYRPGGPDIDRTDGSQPEKYRQIDHWYTQMIAFPGSQLDRGENTIQIQATQFPENSARNKYDDFQIKDMFCFFHQGA